MSPSEDNTSRVVYDDEHSGAEGEVKLTLEDSPARPNSRGKDLKSVCSKLLEWFTSSSSKLLAEESAPTLHKVLTNPVSSQSETPQVVDVRIVSLPDTNDNEVEEKLAEEEGAQRKRAEEFHKSISMQIQACSLTTIVFGLFCVLSLSRKDLEILEGRDFVNVALLNINVPLAYFVLLGPTILLLLYLNLQILLHWKSVKGLESDLQYISPHIFNFGDPLSKLFSFVFLRLLIPVFLYIIFRRSLLFPFNEAGIMVGGVAIISIASLCLFCWGRQIWVRIAILIGTLSSFAFLWNEGPLFFRTDIDLSNAKLELIAFPKILFGTLDLTLSEIGDLDLSEADGEKLSMERAKARCSNMSDIHLDELAAPRADLTGTDFSFATVKKSDFEYAILAKAVFHEGAGAQHSFRRANLQGAYLGPAGANADYTEANLKFAAFDEGGGRKSKFFSADLRGAKFLETDLSESEGLTLDNLLWARVDFEENIILPEYFMKLLDKESLILCNPFYIVSRLGLPNLCASTEEKFHFAQIVHPYFVDFTASPYPPTPDCCKGKFTCCASNAVKEDEKNKKALISTRQVRIVKRYEPEPKSLK